MAVKAANGRAAAAAKAAATRAANKQAAAAKAAAAKEAKAAAMEARAAALAAIQAAAVKDPNATDWDDWELEYPESRVRRGGLVIWFRAIGRVIRTAFAADPARATLVFIGSPLLESVAGAGRRVAGDALRGPGEGRRRLGRDSPPSSWPPRWSSPT